MGEQLAIWFKERGEYVTGAVFGLITLDLFMFLVHCITERTVDGYGLSSLLITISIGAVVFAEKLYHSQESDH